MSLSLLERLPKDVLVQAAGFFDPEALLNCRLTNKNISNDINHIFSRRFFRHRSVFINSESMDILRQVSLSEKYRTLVSSLNVRLHHIPEARTDSERGQISDRASNIIESNRFYYNKLLRDQKWLIESGQAAVLLALALRDLPNCVDVKISDEIYDSDRSFLKSKASRLLTTRTRLPTSRDFVERLISMTMAAINTSGRTLEAFHITRMCKGINIRQLPKLSPGQLGLPFSKLSSLILYLSFDGIQSNEATRLSDWIKLFPSLTSLDLSFNYRLEIDHFSSFSRNLHVNSLATLFLGYVDCDYDDLAILLKSHRNTLHNISLQQVDLNGGVKAWQSFLKLIRDETLINKIDFDCCLSDDVNIYFGDGCGLIITSTESQKFREELDATIPEVKNSFQIRKSIINSGNKSIT